MMHYLLIYDLSPDYLERRGQYRAEHLKLAWGSHDRGELVLGGALGEPVDQAIILFRADGPEIVEKFVRDDPYVKHGLIQQWRIRPWTTVVGAQAATPVRPEA
jgi:uncharacterized protein